MWAILNNRSLYAESHYKKFWLRKAEMELNMLTNPNPNPNSNPLANPNPNPIPNPNSNLNLNPNPNPNPNPIPNPNLSLHPNPNHNPNPSTIPDPNPNPNPNPNLNLNPNSNPNPNSNTNPDLNPSPNQNPDPNPNHNPSPYPNPKPNPNLNPDYNPNSDHNLNPNPNRNPNLNSNPNHNPGSIPNPSPNPDHNLSPHPNPSPNLNTSPNPNPNHSPNPNPNTDPNPSPNPNTSTSADSDPRLRNSFCVPPTNGDLDKVALCCPPLSTEMWSRFPLGVDRVSSSQIFGKEEENPLCIISQAPDLVESAPAPTPCQICATCGTNKTPMWRTGPDGHKTLCNACGIRYKKLKSKSSLRLEQKVDGQHSPKHIPSIAKRKIESQRVGPQSVRSPKRAKLSDLANRATKSMLGKSRTLGASLKNDILYPFAKDEEEGAVLLMALSSSSFA